MLIAMLVSFWAGFLAYHCCYIAWGPIGSRTEEFRAKKEARDAAELKAAFDVLQKINERNAALKP